MLIGLVPNGDKSTLLNITDIFDVFFIWFSTYLFSYFCVPIPEFHDGKNRGSSRLENTLIINCESQVKPICVGFCYPLVSTLPSPILLVLNI